MDSGNRMAAQSCMLALPEHRAVHDRVDAHSSRLHRRLVLEAPKHVNVMYCQVQHDLIETCGDSMVVTATSSSRYS